MSHCETIYDKIIAFEDLTSAAQREVIEHTERCPDCRNRLQVYQALATAATSEQAHPVSDDLLTRYCSYLADPEEPDYDGRTLADAEVEMVRFHLSDCQPCQQKLDGLLAQFEEIGDYLEGTELAMDALNAATLKKSVADLISESLMNLVKAMRETGEAIADKFASPMPKYYPVAIGAVAALLIAVWVGPFLSDSGNPYLSLASLEGEKLSFTTRGAGSGDLNSGLNAFHAGDYASAITELNAVLQNTTNAQDLFYAHFLLGISYLKEAKHDVLGFFERVDSKRVAEAIQHLGVAQSFTENPGQQEECQWFTAKACLALGQKEQSARLLREIIQLRGRRYRDAQKTLTELEAIQ